MEKGKRKAEGEPEAPQSPTKTEIALSRVNGVDGEAVAAAPELSMAIDEDADMPISCLHDVSYPEGYEAPEKGSKPLIPPVPAREYPFTLDPFQREAIQCLENGESVLVRCFSSLLSILLMATGVTFAISRLTLWQSEFVSE
jgi:ATP-dependent RNA helicase DOB1